MAELDISSKTQEFLKFPSLVCEYVCQIERALCTLVLTLTFFIIWGELLKLPCLGFLLGKQTRD